MEEKKRKEGPTTGLNRKKEGESAKRGPKKDPIKTVLMWVAIAVAVVFLLRTLEGAGNQREAKITFTQFQELLAHPKIKIGSVEVNPEGKGYQKWYMTDI